MIKVFSILYYPSGSKFFHLREVPILKKDAIEENHCLIQKSFFNNSLLFVVAMNKS